MNILPWPPRPNSSHHVSYDGGKTFVEIAPPPLPQEPEPAEEIEPKTVNIHKI